MTAPILLYLLKGNSLFSIFKINYSAVFKPVASKAFLHWNICFVRVNSDRGKKIKALVKAKVYYTSAVVFHRNSVNYGVRTVVLPLAAVYFAIGRIIGICFKMKDGYYLTRILAYVACTVFDTYFNITSVGIFPRPLVGISAFIKTRASSYIFAAASTSAAVAVRINIFNLC